MSFSQYTGKQVFEYRGTAEKEAGRNDFVPRLWAIRKVGYLIDEIRHRYDIKVDVISPDHARVQAMVRQHGMNLFYESLEKRRLCCALGGPHLQIGIAFAGQPQRGGC